MRDKSLGIWLIVMFGISGIAVMMLAWLWPTLESERITATLVGSVGILIALIRGLMLRQSPASASDKQVTVKVEAEEKS